MKITVLDASEIEDAAQTFSNVEQLQQHLIDVSPSDSAIASGNHKSRMYLVEDPSSELMDTLVEHFTIDPSFFESYKYNQNWEDPHQYKMLRQLPSRRKETNWYTLHYREVVKLPNNAPRVQDYQIVSHGKAPREISTYEHLDPTKTKINITALVRRNASMWYSKSRDGGCWNAIVLLDPELGDSVKISNWGEGNWQSRSCRATPYLNGYLDFSSWSNPEGRGTAMARDEARRSLRQGIIFYWNLKGSAITDPLAAFSSCNLIIASHWMLLLEHLSGVVSELETRLWSFEEMPQRPSADDLRTQSSHLRGILADVNRWRRRTWWLLEEMKENLEVLKHTGSQGISAEILDDFKIIKTRLEDCRQRIESLLPTVIGAFSLLEAQYASLNTRVSSWVAVLATVFVPLSISSGIFTLSGDYQPGSSKFWYYWVVAIPLMVVISAFVLATMFYRSVLNNMQRRKKRESLPHVMHGSGAVLGPEP